MVIEVFVVMVIVVVVVVAVVVTAKEFDVDATISGRKNDWEGNVLIRPTATTGTTQEPHNVLIRPTGTIQRGRKEG